MVFGSIWITTGGGIGGSREESGGSELEFNEEGGGDTASGAQ
jgi:hypothetical protein